MKQVLFDTYDSGAFNPITFFLATGMGLGALDLAGGSTFLAIASLLVIPCQISVGIDLMAMHGQFSYYLDKYAGTLSPVSLD